ncbi:hypothetical protein IV55_GL000247 [Furfurilactobacillus siliginis]|uniref:Riboflavin transporter n=2 Tax=Furfurilactobacillus siliginis TaxID=348151 RepID=A0A0R2LF69_9LACO|nr:hypothetical protein IV55_GL000247 [Furfurilactobacillus siliginis]
MKWSDRFSWEKWVRPFFVTCSSEGDPGNSNNYLGGIIMGQSPLRRNITVAVLGAVAAVLLLLQFPILPAAPYMQLDLSLLIIMLGTLIYGIGGGTTIALIAALVHLFLQGFNPLYIIGNSIAFVASLLYVIPLYLIITRSRQRDAVKLTLGIVVATLSLTIFMMILNAFVMFPLYMQVGGLPQSTNIPALMFSVVLPFNLIKGVIIGVAFWLVYLRLKPWLDRQRQRAETVHKIS